MRKPLLPVLLMLGVMSLSYGADDRPLGGWNHDAWDGVHVPKLVDSRGKIVGPIYSYGPATNVILTANGVSVAVPIQRIANSAGHYSASQYQWAEGMLQFPTNNCSGAPIVDDITAALRPLIVVRSGVDATAYIAPAGYTETIAIASYLSSQGQCLPTNFQGQVWAGASTYSLTQNYPEPLTIRY